MPPERPAGSASRRQAFAPLFGELLRIRRRNHSPLPPAAPTRTGGAGTPKVPGRSWWEGEGGGAAEPGRQVRPSVRLSFFPPSLRFPSLPPPSRFCFFFWLKTPSGSGGAGSGSAAFTEPSGGAPVPIISNHLPISHHLPSQFPHLHLPIISHHLPSPRLSAPVALLRQPHPGDLPN